MSFRKHNRRYVLVVALLTALLLLLPSPAGKNEGRRIPRVRVRVETVDNSMLDPLGLVYTGVQACTARITGGKHKGLVVPAQNYLNGALDKDKLYKEGDYAIAMLHDSGPDVSVSLVDHDRRGVMGLLVGLLALMLLVFGGASGLGAVVSLAFTCVMIWKAYIPLILTGMSPVAAALLLVVVMTVVIDVLVAGPNKRALTAMLGAFGGTLVTVVLAVLFTRLLNVDGGGLPYIVPLLSQSGMTFDMNQLFLSTMFIGNAGAVIDIAMDLAAGCTEVVRHAPGISGRELLKSGFNIGRMDVGTMTATLVMAYAGSFLSMLLYFSAQGTPLVDILNYRFVASEIMVTLVGCFGLISAAPLTSLLASRIMVKKQASEAKYGAGR